MKPSIFVGSSSEGLPYAKAIKARLAADAEVVVWDSSVAVSAVLVEALLGFSYQFDFAILVLTPDDLLESRGVESRSPRDNVLFELGIFMSTLGRLKTYVVTTKGVKLPSDLEGVTLAYIDPTRADAPVGQMVDTACGKIRTAMQSARDQSTFGLRPSTALAFGYFKNFLEPVCLAFAEYGTTITVSAGETEPPITAADEDIRFIVAVSEDQRRLAPEVVTYLRKRDSSFHEVILKSAKRSFPFYTLMRKRDGDAWEFFDVPTTLRMSYEILEKALPESDSNVRDDIFRREVANFQETIERLAKQSPIQTDIEVRELDSYLGL